MTENTRTEAWLYQVKIENGYKVLEEGHFFPALPFIIEGSLADLKQRVVEVRFQRGSGNKVVYTLHENKQLLDEWTHPDYVPEQQLGLYPDPYTLDDFTAMLAAAFSLLQISQDKAYLECFPIRQNEAGKNKAELKSGSQESGSALEKKPPRFFSFTVKQEFSMQSMYPS